MKKRAAKVDWDRFITSVIGKVTVKDLERGQVSVKEFLKDVEPTHTKRHLTARDYL